MVVEVTSGGVDAVTVAHVLVDDAYWSFSLPRRAHATATR
jgi:hypothetical protein